MTNCFDGMIGIALILPLCIIGGQQYLFCIFTMIKKKKIFPNSNSYVSYSRRDQLYLFWLSFHMIKKGSAELQIMLKIMHCEPGLSIYTGHDKNSLNHMCQYDEGVPSKLVLTGIFA